MHSTIESVKVLQAYSPLHNIETGVEYPLIFVTGSTTDDRTGLGHRRKFIARLKEVRATKAFFYEAAIGRHGVSRSNVNIIA